MSLNTIIITGLFYLIPGNIEILYREKLSSDADLSAVATLTIIRNFLYTCGLSSLILTFTPFKILGFFSYCLFLYSIYEYFRSIKYRLPFLY